MSTAIEISDAQSFKKAVSDGYKRLKIVNDIDFADETIWVNHDLEVFSSNDCLKNVHFDICGPTTVGEKIDVSFSDTIFDGGFDASSFNASTSSSFEDIFGSDRTDMRCISADSGYFSLSLKGCDVRNYASDTGPAIHLENYDLDDSKSVSLTDCRFYGNCSSWDTLHLSHNKLNVSMDGCEFYGNYAYKGAGFSIANGCASISNVKVHDNVFVPFDINQNNFQLAGGGVYLGGAEIYMKDSVIANNESIYGGGLAVATPFAGNKTICFENVSIMDNVAKYGGGIAAFSLYGQPVAFIDCLIYANKAVNGSSLYTETYSKWLKENDGGLVQFFFSTFALNQAEDDEAYSFYKEGATKGNIGTIAIKGCVSIGDDKYVGTEGDYNYVATKEKAISEGVTTEDDLNSARENGLKLKKEQTVGYDVYSNWSPLLVNKSGTRAIGQGTSSSNSFLWVLLWAGIPTLAVIAFAVAVLLTKKKKEATPVSINQESPAEDTIPEENYLNSLKERELQVVKMIISGKRRKEIAQELNYSENTIKKDLTAIYTKLHVKEKTELILKYKDLI